jgi:hypothetical protein
MDEIIYNAFGSYYNALEKLGYISYPQSQKLLLLCFYRDFVFHDYRGLLNKEDYYLIERALDCLWGSTCLIPYPDYLKMGKLHIGEMTEMAQRVKNLENTSVLKAFDAEGASGDIIITAEEEED